MNAELRDSSWPYTPMPDELYEPIRSGLQKCDFDSQAILTDFPFTSLGARSIRINCVAFADPKRWDTDTASVAVYYNPSKVITDEFAVREIAVSGAPIVILGDAKSVSLFGVSANGRPQPHRIRSGIDYSDVPNVLEQYAVDINPRRILEVKHGLARFVTAFADANPLQLRLWAVEATRGILAKQFGSAVEAIRQSLQKHGVTFAQNQLDTKLATQLLGAVILAHKGRLGKGLQSSAAPLSEILRATQSNFRHYFDHRLFEKYWDAASNAFSILQEVVYTNFTPEMLDELYLQAYSSRVRKAEGRFDTPLYLTRLILNNIPIEFIPPADRLAVDFTCGWGSFLVATYERLNRIGDMPESGRPLWKHIIGNDLDSFTAELARLALLTTSLDDSWEVRNEDALRLKLTGPQPTVVVGNPKFYADRKAGKAATEIDRSTGERKRLQEADNFLQQAIRLLKPGGYLGMLMPQSFSIAEASTYTRKMLLEECDVLELWDLPLAVFGPQAAVSPMVIFAQKRDKRGEPLNYPVRIRAAQGKVLEKVGVFNTASIAPSQSRWGEASRKARQSSAKVTNLITYKTILPEQKWEKITERCQKLVEVADITPGAIVGTKRTWRNYDKPKLVLWLSGAKQSMPRPFYIEYGATKILYPNELERPRKNRRFPERDQEHLLAGPKVLLVSDPNPSWGKRTKVAIERRGYYPSHHFWIIVPKSEVTSGISLEVLAAILSWDVCNAWVVESFRYPWIRKQVLEDIPFPLLLERDIGLLEKAVKEIETAAQRSQIEPQAQAILDDVLKKAYQLDENTFRTLRTVMEWDTKPLEVERHLPPDPSAVFHVYGQVESVDVHQQTISIWFEGIPATHTVPIADAMPGWMLREGASFQAQVSFEALRKQEWGKLKWWSIIPKEYSYLADDKLLQRVADELSGV